MAPIGPYNPPTPCPSGGQPTGCDHSRSYSYSSSYFLSMLESPQGAGPRAQRQDLTIAALGPGPRARAGDDLPKATKDIAPPLALHWDWYLDFPDRAPTARFVVDLATIGRYYCMRILGSDPLL